MLTSFAGAGKEAGVYMVQFTTPQPPTNVASSTTVKKDAPKTVPVIDLTESQHDSPPRSQALPVSSFSTGLSAPNIASKAVSSTVVAPKRVVTAVPTIPSATASSTVRASIPSVTVSVGQLLGRPGVSASQQHQVMCGVGFVLF